MTARFIRTTGERYDGDWFSGPSCDCGCDYHGHECEYQIDYSPEYLAMTPDEREAALKAAQDKIAAVFAPTGWERAEVSALAKRDAA
ncbi:hypothetical protein SH584_11340 [Sphingomonas sp. LY29]|uniref:hypothetical protein n=1 Tax=Sphingomonas sp. LY29 TaxID=3095341 RepID=UPI002D76BEE6|nr:hypothetical protein [Sphingomonas sp. LY29]WRP25625.1 hypothetical protein SH584_11340 [Sphingomonas sp. LY29]